MPWNVQPTPLPGAHLSDGASRSIERAWLGASANWAQEGTTSTVLGLSINNPASPVPAFDALHLGALRYPGGSVSQTWDYTSGTPTGTVLANPVPMSLFASLCAGRSLRPVVVLGISRGSDAASLLDPNNASDAAEMDARVSALVAGLGGLAIEHIEIGNEVYDNATYKTDITQYGPLSVGEYAAAAVAWIARLQAALPMSSLPGLRFGLSFSADDTAWNTDLSLEIQQRIALAQLDPSRLAATMHPYYGSLSCDDPGCGTCDWKDADPGERGFWIADCCQAAQWTNFAEPWVDASNPGGAALVIGRAQSAVSKRVAALAGLGGWLSQVPLWFTETNVFNRCGPDRLTWAAGLAMLAHLFEVMRSSQGSGAWVDLCTPHALSHGRAGHQLIYDDDDAFVYLNDGSVYPFVPTPPVSNPVSTPGKWSPAGLVIARLGMALGTATTAIAQQFSQQVTVKASNNVHYEGLQGWRFPQASGRSRYLIANLTGLTQRVLVHWMPDRIALIDHAPPTQWITRPGDVTHQEVPLSRGGEDLPPWSILLTESAGS